MFIYFCTIEPCLEGFGWTKIKFSYGNESSVIEFSRNQAFEMDDESRTNRSTAGDYDAETNGDTVVVTIYGNDRANDIYTLNFSTELPEVEHTKTLYICNQTK